VGWMVTAPTGSHSETGPSQHLEATPMHSHHATDPSRRIPRLAVAVLALAAAAGLSAVTTAGAQEAEDGLEICHRTNSNAHPYIVIETDANGQNGGTDHLGEHTGPLWNPTLKQQHLEWGDVVPPTDENPLGSEAYQDIIALGQDPDAFIANGCTSVVITPNVGVGGVSLDKVTTGGTAPAGTTSFGFTVSCESGDVVPAPSVTVDQSFLQIAGGVATDDFCTVTESSSNGATSTTFQVTGANNISTTSNSVTFSVIQDTTAFVTVTNAYPEPAVPAVVTTTTTAPAQVGGVQVTTTTTAPAQVLATTGSPAPLWYVLAGAAFLFGGLSLFGSTSARLARAKR
jgi:archaellin